MRGVTCSTDRSARLYKVPFAPLEAGPVERDVSAVLEFHGKHGFRALDHHWQSDIFATAGNKVCSHSSCCLTAVWRRRYLVEHGGEAYDAIKEEAEDQNLGMHAERDHSRTSCLRTGGSSVEEAMDN